MEAGALSEGRIFLTGSTGNAGRGVHAELVKLGTAITALVRRPTMLGGSRTVVAELATIDQLAEEISAATAIVHLGSPRSLDPDSVWRDEIRATRLMLAAWRRGPFVYVSSPRICAIPLERLDEHAPIDPETWFDIGKLVNEFQVRRAAADPVEDRGPGISLRPGAIFASGDRRNDRQTLSDVYHACRLGNTFLFDSEEGLETYGMSFIGAQDFGRAVATALSLEESGVYNVAGGDFTWRELIEAIDEQAGTKSDFVVRPDTRPGPGEFRVPQSRFYLDTSKFVSATRFVPQQSLDELVIEYVNAEKQSKPDTAPAPHARQHWLDQFMEPVPLRPSPIGR